MVGVLVEPEGQRYRARGHLPVRRGAPDDQQVYAHAVGPTFNGNTPGQAYRACEEWVAGYLNLAYRVSFRVRRMDEPFFGPSHFTGVRVYSEQAARPGSVDDDVGAG